MKRFLSLALVFGLLILAPSVWADPITATAGDSFSVTYNGGAPPVPGLTAEGLFSNFAFTQVGAYTRVNFNIALENTTSGISASRISVLGFKTTPDITINPPGALISTVSTRFGRP